jgi:hypothetical protein
MLVSMVKLGDLWYYRMMHSATCYSGTFEF